MNRREQEIPPLEWRSVPVTETVTDVVWTTQESLERKKFFLETKQTWKLNRYKFIFHTCYVLVFHLYSNLFVFFHMSLTNVNRFCLFYEKVDVMGH